MSSYTLRSALLCVTLFFAPLTAQQFVVTTVAGGALPTTPALGVNVSVHYPRALFVDTAGSTYFTTGNAVLKLDKGGTVTRFAGSATAGYSGDGGPATNARLYYPFGITADQAGNVFIADLGNAVVRKVTPDGIISTYAGDGQYGFAGDGGPATQASLGTVGGVAVDSNGNLYIGDVGYGLIRKVAPDGTISKVLGSGVSSPWGLACDASGNLYIADANANVVRKMTPQGALTTIAGTGTAGNVGDDFAATAAQLNTPYGVSADTAGNLYISDTGNNVIRMVDTKGIIRVVAGKYSNFTTDPGDGLPATAASLQYPQGAAADSDGNLFISDLADNRIRKVTADKIIHTVVGGVASSAGDGGPAFAAQLNGPYGTGVDKSGNLYIADSLNNKVRKVAPDGTITTLAGDGIVANPLGDGGPALKAHLNMPWTVAADGQGNVFIADFRNPEVRKVDASGKITSFSGTPYSAGLAFDSAGNLYVAAYVASQIWKIAPNGQGAVYAGAYFGNIGPHFGGDGGPAAKALFAQPTGLAFDSNGNLYIADAGNQRVRKISAGGVVSTVAGNGTAGFSGDGGLATQAKLNAPSGVAVDPAGNLYIADWNNSRIRMVDAAGIITTVAGSDNFGYSGDGGLATNAAIGSPAGISADANGNLFVADQYNSVIRLLTPKGRSSVFSILNSHSGLAIAGQPLSSTVVVSNSAIAGASSGNVAVKFALPSAMALSSPIVGSGWTCTGTSCTRSDALAPGASYPPLTVNVTLAANALGQTMSNAVVSGGGSLYSVSAQDVMNVLPPGNYCSYKLDATAAALPPSTASGTVGVSTDAGCQWSAAADQAWVTLSGASSGAGPGSVSYSVAANSGAARTSTLTIGGQSFIVQQASAASAAIPLTGVLAHFDSGDTWASTLTVVNTAPAPAEAAVNFYDAQGNPVALHSTFPQIPAQGAQQVATWDQTLAANALAVLDTRQTVVGDTVGSAQLRAGAGVSGFEVFANLLSGQQAVVPLETREAPSYLLAFDNTGILKTGLAIANVSGTAGNVNVIIRDDTGQQIGTETEHLDALSHDSFMLSKWAETVGKRGTVEFDTPSGGRVTVLGLRVNGQALTTLPVLAQVGTGGGSLAHVATGAGWETIFTLVNTGATAAEFTLSFFEEKTGVPLPLTFVLPQTGTTPQTATFLNQWLAAGATLLIHTQGSSATVTCSAQLTTTGKVSGFAIFQIQVSGQEAVVPLEIRTPAAFVLAYDNTNGLATGVALANLSATTANIDVVVRDDTGATLISRQIQLAGNGHDSFMLTDATLGFPVTAGKRGTVEFDTPAGAKINALGIRAVPATGVVTTVPVLAK